MALKIHEVKDTIRELTKQRAEIDEKLAGLQRYLGAPKAVADGKVAVSGIPVGSGPDLKPMLLTLFQANGNNSMRLKDIVAKLVADHEELDKAYVDAKMRYLKTHYLTQDKEAGYGMFRLPPG